MHYTHNGIFLIADDGWVFQPKFTTGVMPKMIFAASAGGYDVVPEPTPEPEPEIEPEEDAGSDI